MKRFGIAVHLAIATIGVAAVALVIVGVGVQRVGESEFERLMVLHGASVEAAHDMFASSVTIVLLAALAAALCTTLFLATALARWMSRPVLRMSQAAADLASGDYTVRMRASGPREVSSLAESFNLLAEELGLQERVRQEFIENAAHELRTPLTNLRGYLEGLRDGVIAPGRPVFSSLHEEVQRLSRLTESLELLATGRRRPPLPRCTDVVAALRTAIEATRPVLDGNSITLVTHLPDAAWVLVDSDHLAQIIANLLQNASRYTNEGGLVEVRVDEEGTEVTVQVANTGRGIPAEDLPRIFERFYRVDKSRSRQAGGAGVGLAIVKQLIMAAEGDVGVDSYAGRTRFWFRLPAADRAAGDVAATV